MAAPDRGALVWLDFSPQAGREQAYRRPAVVLSPRSYHQLCAYAVVCPVTSRVRGGPFEVPLPEGMRASGVCLVDQIRSVDRHARRIEVVGQVSDDTLRTILGKLALLLYDGGPP